jgi:hypothetical protein
VVLWAIIQYISDPNWKAKFYLFKTRIGRLSFLKRLLNNLILMFPLFPRRKRKPLRFPALEASGLEDRYFHRTSRYTRVGEILRVLNSEHIPSVIPLTPWEAHIYELASGTLTVGQLVRSTAARYQKTPQIMPKEILIKDRLILELSDTPVELPYYLSLPIHQQDEAKARKLMERDNFKD